jgi:sterol desaturase/sphingolipid hydroxylase (fatty acid hydroxylase superfamily)
MNDPRDDSWLVRPTTIRLLWRLFIIVLALTVLAQLVFKVKGYFGVDGWFGFAAVFGFGACLIMVLLAKLLGGLLKRDESYYDEGNADD